MRQGRNQLSLQSCTAGMAHCHLLYSREEEGVGTKQDFVQMWGSSNLVLKKCYMNRECQTQTSSVFITVSEPQFLLKSTCNFAMLLNQHAILKHCGG